MKNKLFFTSYALSFVGLLALIVTFFESIKGDEKRIMAMAVIIAIIMCGLATWLFIYLKKAWVVWCALLALAGLFLFVFKKEIIGGYMTLFNNITEMISREYEMEVYYCDKPKSYLRKADIKLTINYTVILLGFVYGWCASRCSMGWIAGAISTFGIVMCYIMGKNPSAMWLWITIMFIIAMLIMNTSQAFVKKNDNKRLYLQIASLAAAAGVFIIGIISSLIVRESTYVKSPVYENVADSIVSLYEKIELALTSLGGNGGGGDSSIESEGDGKTIINNGELGQTDEINYTNELMVRVYTMNYDDSIYLKQFVGVNFKNNTWDEPKWTGEPAKELKKLGVYPQHMTCELIGTGIGSYDWTGWHVNCMRIDYVNLDDDRQLMPIYSGAMMYGYEPKSEAYFERDDLYFSYWDVERDTILSWIKIMNEPGYSTILNGIYQQAYDIYNDYVYDTYLDVKTDCAEQLIEMFGGSDISSTEKRYMVADRVAKYLHDNCSYSLSPGKVPEGKDLVDYFLNESHEGYCTYYASAAVMMLRAAGIPARYVNGFYITGDNLARYDNGIVFDDEPDDIFSCQYDVLDSDAHAWVEFYIDDFGWVTFDPTNSSGNEYQEPVTEEVTDEVTTAEPEIETTKDNTVETEPQTEKNTSESQSTETEESTTLSEPAGGKTFRISEETLKMILYVLIIVILVSGFFAFIILRHKYVLNKWDNIYAENRTDNKKECVCMLYRRMEKILKALGVVHDEYMTYEEFAEHVGANCPYISKENAVIAVSLYEKALFSDEDITESELAEYEAIEDSLRISAYEGQHFYRKIIFKYIYNIYR